MLVIIFRANPSNIVFGILLGLGVLLVCCGFDRHVERSGQRWCTMMRADAIVTSLAVTLFVEEAWSIMMVLACSAFGARTFKVIFAEQRYVGNRLAPW